MRPLFFAQSTTVCAVLLRFHFNVVQVQRIAGVTADLVGEIDIAIQFLAVGRNNRFQFALPFWRRNLLLKHFLQQAQHDRCRS